MKKILKSIFIFLIVCCFTAACTKENEEVITDAVRFKEEYESINGEIREKDGKTIRSVTIPEDNPMVYKTAEELVEMIQNKETFVVYFGFKDCPWCRSMVSTMIEVANDLNISKVYYVDVKEIRDTLTISEDGEVVISKEGTEAYKKLLDLLANVLDDYTLTDSNGKKMKTNEKRIYAPNVVAIKNGEAIKKEEGISSKQEDGYAELTDEIKSEMYEQLECVMKCILTTTNTCTKDKC